MKTAKRTNRPQMLQQIQKITSLLGKEKIYFINFSNDNLVEFNQNEIETIFANNNMQLEVVDEYIPPILFFKSKEITSLNQLNQICNQCSQAIHFGQVISITETPEESPCITSRQTLLQQLGSEFPSFDYNNLNTEQGRPKFSMVTNMIGINWQQNQKIEHLNSFYDAIDISTFKVDIKNPDFHTQIIYDYVSNPTRYIIGLKLPNTSNIIPLRRFMQQFNLPQRQFLGPTSMDSSLAFLMCNLAKLRSGHFVMDPFCGTCSILISASAMGAYCIGGDLDIKILRGKEKTYVDSFKQYNLPYSDICWQDASQIPLKQKPFLDAIITDPPYHIRASSKKQTFAQESIKNSTFGAQCEQFSLKDLILNLVRAASLNLVVGGRLVFWLPVPVNIRDFGSEDLPISQNLRLICWPEQPLSTKYARKLIVYEKIADNKDDNIHYVKNVLRFENIRKVLDLE